MLKVKDIKEYFSNALKYEKFTIDKTGVKTIELINACFEADESYIIRKPNEDYIKRELEWYESQSLMVQDIPGETPAIWKSVASNLGVINSNYGYLAYSGDNYGVSVTYGALEVGTNGANTNTYTALNGYYSFDNGLNISAGYEVGDVPAGGHAADESINYFVGVNGEVGPGELGAALGTSGGQLENQTEELMYEAYYSYPVNDGMTITPLVFVKEQATVGTPDQTGVMVKTTFKF